jgi:hypothetical protein
MRAYFPKAHSPHELHPGVPKTIKLGEELPDDITLHKLEGGTIKLGEILKAHGDYEGRIVINLGSFT